jgi:hypothetical protein
LSAAAATGQGAWFVLRASNLPCRNGSEQQIKQNIRRRQVTKQGISSLVCCAVVLCQVLVLGAE